MSQPAISAGVAARPSPSLRSPANAVPVTATNTNRMRTALRHFDILDLAIGLHQPGLDAVVVVDRIDAADLAQRVLRGLHVAGLVDRARLQQHLLTRPFGLGVETHAGLVERQAVDPRRAPVPAAVARDVDARNLAAPGPGK